MNSFSTSMLHFVNKQKIAMNIIYAVNLSLMIIVSAYIISVDSTHVSINSEKIFHIPIICSLLIIVSFVNFISLSNPDRVILDIKNHKYKASSSFGSFLIKKVEKDFFNLPQVDQHKCAVIIAVTLSYLRSWILNFAVVIVAVSSQYLGVISSVLMYIILAVSFIATFIMYPKLENYFKKI